MPKWKMTAEDIYHILRYEQNYRCFLSGRELEPKRTRVVLKVPRHMGGKFERSNICLVDQLLVNLARSISISEIEALCREISEYRESGAWKQIMKPKDIPTKGVWMPVLHRMVNLNVANSQESKAKESGIATWGEKISEQIAVARKIYIK
jgi:hypothetical protein